MKLISSVGHRSKAMKHFLKWIFVFFSSSLEAQSSLMKNLMFFALFMQYFNVVAPFFSSLTSLRWGMSSSYYFIFSAYGFEEKKRQMLEGIWHQQRHNLIFQFLLAFPQNFISLKRCRDELIKTLKVSCDGGQLDGLLSPSDEILSLNLSPPSTWN